MGFETQQISLMEDTLGEESKQLIPQISELSASDDYLSQKSVKENMEAMEEQDNFGYDESLLKDDKPRNSANSGGAKNIFAKKRD